MKEEEIRNFVDSTARAFQRSRVFLTAIELGIFRSLKEGSRTPRELALSLKISEKGAKVLLRALASMGLIGKSGERYKLNHVSKFLVKDKNETVLNSFMHVAHGWERWSSLTKAVKKGSIAEFSSGKSHDRKWRNYFISAMEVSSKYRARPVAEAIKGILKQSRKMIDLGGGSGGYAKAFLGVNPNLEVTVFDRPEIIPLAKRYLGNYFLKNFRIRLQGGDFLIDDFGEEYDLVFLSSIIHIYSPETIKKLLKSVFRSLNDGGWVVIQDFILEDTEIAPPGAALFGVHMLVSTEEGSTYTKSEIRNWLKFVGFRRVQFLSLDGTSLVKAKKL